MLRLTFHATGPRVHILGKRVHHGSFGLVLAVVGALLAWHDRDDCRVWFCR